MTNVELMTAAVIADPLNLLTRGVLADALQEEYGSDCNPHQLALEVAIKARTELLLIEMDKKASEYFGNTAPKHTVKYNKKWAVIRRKFSGGGREEVVVAFVALQKRYTTRTGFVPAGAAFRATGKTYRKSYGGNVLEELNFLTLSGMVSKW